MLVLTRKKNEAIVVGNDVTVTVVEVKGGRVKLSIEAPQSVGIARREVWVEPKQNQEQDQEQDKS